MRIKAVLALLLISSSIGAEARAKPPGFRPKEIDAIARSDILSEILRSDPWLVFPGNRLRQRLSFQGGPKARA